MNGPLEDHIYAAPEDEVREPEPREWLERNPEPGSCPKKIEKGGQLPELL